MSTVTYGVGVFRVVFACRTGAPGASARPVVDESLPVSTCLEALEWAVRALKATRDQSLLDSIETVRVIDLSKKQERQSSLAPMP